MTTKDIKIRDARKEDAPSVARLIMVAMREECCRYFYGEGHTAEEFHQVMTALVAQERSQYSYKNTICATDKTGRVVGIVVGYDGAQLKVLRRAFIEAVRLRFGRDFSDMDDETEAGELYIDSLAVEEDCRGRGIATLLLTAIEEMAKRAGIARLGLLMEQDNDTAERLYRKQGFKTVGERNWGGHRLRHLQKVTTARRMRRSAQQADETRQKGLNVLRLE